MTKNVRCHIGLLSLFILLIESCGIDENDPMYRLCEGSTEWIVSQDTGRVYSLELDGISWKYIGSPDAVGGGLIPCYWRENEFESGDLVVYGGELREVVPREGESVVDPLYLGILLSYIYKIEGSE